MINNLHICMLLVLIIFVHGADVKCSCTKLKSESDCQKFPLQYCEWKNNSCIVSNESTQNPIIESKPFCSQYQYQQECQQAFICSNCLNKQEMCDGCLKQYPCIWEDKQCVFFTGCTAYLKQSHQDCFKISRECTSDLTQCIEIGKCTEYNTRDACKQNNINGRLCTWDPQLGCKEIKVCSDISQQPSLSHEGCNSQLSKCTVNNNGQCIDLFTECVDYTFEDQCRLTYSKVECIWQNDACRDKTCDDAPLNYDSSERCKQFLKFCIYKSGGGCQKIIYCSEIKHQNGCQGKVDTNGKSCFWESTYNQCVIHQCENAPLEYQTDKQCQSFKSECVTNEGSGCKLNKGCNAMITQQECNTKKSLEGKDCMWEETCIEKTCENASTELKTHEQCEKFLFKCTTNNGYGCQLKSCKNAPDTMKTNEDCEKYLPDNHCIARSGGGCVKNDSCSKVSLAIACVKDINGSDCYWYDTTGQCITKQCDKAPTTIKTQAECEAFWSKCQVNQSGTGCEDKICENFQDKSKCEGQLDFYGKGCSYRNKCIEKTCKRASELMKTHEECNAYLNTCTLSLTGKGCMTLPLKCEIIKLEEGCGLRSSIGQNNVVTTKECTWKNNKCQDKSCQTAPITKNSNSACQEYMEGCYVNNDRKGCWILPECNQRALLETCEIQNNYDCVWDEGNQKCLVRSCVSTLYSSDKANYTSVQGCNQYRLNTTICSKQDGIGCCTLNDQGLGCMRKPDTCSQLKTKINCSEKALFLGGDCLWTGEICVPSSCNALNLKIYNLNYNHANCFQKSYSSCTVNESATACIDLKSSCTQYTPNDQCKIEQKASDGTNGNQCVIRFSTITRQYYCDIEKCGDVVSKSYNSFAACQGYNPTCTVIARVNGKGCIDKQQYCFNYKFPEQCFKTLDGQKCIWNNNRCWDFDKVECSSLVLLNYSTQTCENFVSYCKVKSNNTECIMKTCVDYTTQTEKTGGPIVSQLSHCQAIKVNNVRCSINNALNACVVEQERCSTYSPQDCYFSSLEGPCKTNGTECYFQFQLCSTWSSENDEGCKKNREFCQYPSNGVGKVACINRSCEDKVGINLTEEVCNQFDQTCTVNKDKTKCILIQGKCGTYKDEIYCMKSSDSNCIWQVGVSSECVGITTLIEAEKNCQYKKGLGLTYKDCQSFSSFCSINRAGNQCVAKKPCEQYTILDCYKSEAEYCIQSQQEDLEAVCKSPSNTNCESIFLGKTTVYSLEKCSQINKNCKNQGTFACTLKTCENAIGPFTHESCVGWKSTCTVTNTNNGCQEMKNRCFEYEFNSCLRSLLDGICVQDLKQNLCVKKTCYSSSDTLTSDEQCEQFMATCTVAQAGGCMLSSTCDSYITELQCVQDNQNRICFWNPSFQKCVFFECKSIEQTEKYDSHEECYELNNIQDTKKKNMLERCTVNITPDPNDPTISNRKGCMNLLGCHEYNYKEQCVIDSTGQYCKWNSDNPENEFCEMTTCQSADPNTFSTHQACIEYQLNANIKYQDKCTVAVVEIAPGVLKAQGCRSRADCEEYKIEDQCKYSSAGLECKWDKIDQACYTRLCNKAPLTFKTHERCSEFSPNCTLTSTLIGCMDLTPKCEDYKVKSQCTKSIYGNLCFWNGIECVTRLCSNTPQDLDGECSTYLNTCESSGKLRCVTVDCEQYSFVTDAACKSAGFSGKCTTDGTRCVLRTSCEEARTQDACKFNDLGQQCVWYPPTVTNDGYCEISICELASKVDFVSELQCKSYNAGCTLKKQGGCKLIQDCNSFELESSCTVSKDHKICTWEKDKGCRSNDCSDLSGTDHFKCKSQNKMCTTSKTGQCVNMETTCAKYQIAGSCVETSDGFPCLWVKALRNDNNPEGQCIQYLKCEDISLTTDAQCKSVFKNCTSNGQTCIPITKCQNLNSTNCKQGSDGQCMLALKDATSTTKTCMIFKKCSDAFYKTHQECQLISQYCTTGGTQCMDLKQTCSEYQDKSQCFITIQSNDSSTSNICVWDNACRNEKCSDIDGASHKFCNSKINSCTSDGIRCMTIQTCESYTTYTKCNFGYGKIDDSHLNPCHWTDTTKDTGSYCRVKACADILPASSFFCSEVNSCVYDATKLSCITKQSSCSSYQDQNACNSGTLTSQTCYWADNKCQQLTGCQVITDQTLCLSLKGCSYITQNGTPSCVTSDCSKVYQSTSSCKFYETFTNTLTSCMLQNGECKQADPSNLNIENCMVNSNYTYTWNSVQSKCITCFEALPNDTITSNNNTTEVDSAQKISITMIILAAILG